MNYYEHYMGDYGKKTSGLAMIAHGAYRILLDAYYATEQPLPNDLDELYRVARAMTKDEQKAVRTVVERFFPVAEDGLRHNERADQEIVKAHKRINSARVNGKNGGRKPKGEPDGNPPGNPSGIPMGNPPETQRASQPLTQELTGSKARHAPRSITTQEGEGVTTPWPGNLSPETWAAWKSHLTAVGKGMTPPTERLQLVRLAEHSNPEQVVRTAVENGWKNLSPIGGYPSEKTQETRHGKAEKRARTYAALTGRNRQEGDEQPPPNVIDIRPERFG